jgi:hypothetical protein
MLVVRTQSKRCEEPLAEESERFFAYIETKVMKQSPN